MFSLMLYFNVFLIVGMFISFSVESAATAEKCCHKSPCPDCSLSWAIFFSLFFLHLFIQSLSCLIKQCNPLYLTANSYFSWTVP